MNDKTAKTLNKINSTIAGISSLASNTIDQVGTNKSLDALVDEQTGMVANTQFGAATTEGLLNQWSTFNLAAMPDRSNYRQSFGDIAKNSISNIAGGAVAGSAFGPIGTVVGAGLGAVTSLVGGLTKGAKLRKQRREHQNKVNAANTTALQNFNNAVETNTKMSINNALTNYAKDGGFLATSSMDFPTGIDYIEEGGQHEENPLGGVPISIDPQGTPNLAEEGEVIYNNYVFSNSLTVPKELAKKYKLSRNSTFAEAVKKYDKTWQEMPNDSITNKGKEIILSELMGAQEYLRQLQMERQQFEQNVNLFNNGGYPKLAREQRRAERRAERAATRPERIENLKNLLSSAGEILPTLSSAASLLSLKPDYSSLDYLAKNLKTPSYVRPTAVGGKLEFESTPYNTYINNLNSQTQGLQRQVLNSGISRQAALSNLASIRNNANTQLGSLLDNLNNQSLQRRNAIRQTNLGIDQFNAQQDVQAQQFNATLQQQHLGNLQNLATFRDQIDSQYQQSKSAALNNMLQNLYNMHKDRRSMEMANSISDYNVDGTYKNSNKQDKPQNSPEDVATTYALKRKQPNTEAQATLDRRLKAYTYSLLNRKIKGLKTIR